MESALIMILPKGDYFGHVFGHFASFYQFVFWFCIFNLNNFLVKWSSFDEHYCLLLVDMLFFHIAFLLHIT